MAQPPFAGYPPHQVRRDSGMAIGGLIFSLLGLFGLVTVVPGIILGHVAFARARRGEASGKGIAIAAFVIGYLLIVAYAIAIPVLLNIAAKHGAFR
jgi:hypothetical protein